MASKMARPVSMQNDMMYPWEISLFDDRTVKSNSELRKKQAMTSYPKITEALDHRMVFGGVMWSLIRVMPTQAMVFHQTNDGTGFETKLILQSCVDVDVLYQVRFPKGTLPSLWGIVRPTKTKSIIVAIPYNWEDAGGQFWCIITAVPWVGDKPLDQGSANAIFDQVPLSGEYHRRECFLLEKQSGSNFGGQNRDVLSDWWDSPPTTRRLPITASPLSMATQYWDVPGRIEESSGHRTPEIKRNQGVFGEAQKMHSAQYLLSIHSGDMEAAGITGIGPVASFRLVVTNVADHAVAFKMIYFLPTGPQACIDVIGPKRTKYYRWCFWVTERGGNPGRAAVYSSETDDVEFSWSKHPGCVWSPIPPYVLTTMMTSRTDQVLLLAAEVPDGISGFGQDPAEMETTFVDCFGRKEFHRVSMSSNKTAPNPYCLRPNAAYCLPLSPSPSIVMKNVMDEAGIRTEYLGETIPEMMERSWDRRMVGELNGGNYQPQIRLRTARDRMSGGFEETWRHPTGFDSRTSLSSIESSNLRRSVSNVSVAVVIPCIYSHLLEVVKWTRARVSNLAMVPETVVFFYDTPTSPTAYGSLSITPAVGHKAVVYKLFTTQPEAVEASKPIGIAVPYCGQGMGAETVKIYMNQEALPCEVIVAVTPIILPDGVNPRDLSEGHLDHLMLTASDSQLQSFIVKCKPGSPPRQIFHWIDRGQVRLRAFFWLACFFLVLVAIGKMAFAAWERDGAQEIARFPKNLERYGIYAVYELPDEYGVCSREAIWGWALVTPIRLLNFWWIYLLDLTQLAGAWIKHGDGTPLKNPIRGFGLSEYFGCGGEQVPSSLDLLRAFGTKKTACFVAAWFLLLFGSLQDNIKRAIILVASIVVFASPCFMDGQCRMPCGQYWLISGPACMSGVLLVCIGLTMMRDPTKRTTDVWCVCAMQLYLILLNIQPANFQNISDIVVAYTMASTCGVLCLKLEVLNSPFLISLQRQLLSFLAKYGLVSWNEVVRPDF